MSKVRVAVVGTGYWGINYVRVFAELPQSEVVLVCDQSQERIEEIGRRFPGLETTTDLNRVLSRPDVDAVVICTPATTHYRVAADCLAAGKHILIEKPITILSRDAQALVDQARAGDRVLMVGHTFIHNGGVQKLKSYVEQGDIGHPYYLYSRRTNMGPIRGDVNALWDLAPHDISIFNYLLDSVPAWVSAVGARVLGSPREDVGFITLGYPNGVIGHIHVSWADPNKVREIVVVGSDKRLVFDDLNSLEKVRVYEKGVRASTEPSTYGESQFQMRDGDIISPRINGGEPLKNQCAHFVRCVAEGLDPLTGGKQGQDVVMVMEAVDASVARNGAPVEVGDALVPALQTADAPVTRLGNGHSNENGGKLPWAARAMMDAVQETIIRQTESGHGEAKE